MKNFLKSFFEIYFLVFLFKFACCQTDPIITSWKKSNGTGYSGITADVDKVQYSANYVYVHTSGIPSYSIGPWANNPNTPKNMDATYKFTRNPTAASTKTATPMGHIGILINGVALYNPQDGYSYNNLGAFNI